MERASSCSFGAPPGSFPIRPFSDGRCGGGHKPLSFVVFVPSWREPKSSQPVRRCVEGHPCSVREGRRKLGHIRIMLNRNKSRERRREGQRMKYRVFIQFIQTQKCSRARGKRAHTRTHKLAIKRASPREERKRKQGKKRSAISPRFLKPTPFRKTRSIACLLPATFTRPLPSLGVSLAP